MSSTTVSLQPYSSNRRQYFGIIYDNYTPQVESQILRDCLALKQLTQLKKLELVIVCEDARCDNVLRALSIRRVPTKSLTKSWILYKTKKEQILEPEDSTVIVHRDLFQPIKKNKLEVLDESQSNGFYLPPQGRIGQSVTTLLRPAPNGYAVAEPSFALLWS